MNIANYNTSKDYARLWELAHTNRIICIVDYGDHECRDAAKTLFHPKSKYSEETVEVSGRGIGYIWAHSVEEFIKQCERDHVEFFEPVNTEPNRKHVLDDLTIKDVAPKEPEPMLMSIKTFANRKDEIEHTHQPEENIWRYNGRKISIISEAAEHACALNRLMDNTCGVCGKQVEP